MATKSIGQHAASAAVSTARTASKTVQAIAPIEGTRDLAGTGISWLAQSFSCSFCMSLRKGIYRLGFRLFLDRAITDRCGLKRWRGERWHGPLSRKSQRRNRRRRRDYSELSGRQPEQPVRGNSRYRRRVSGFVAGQ